MNSETISVATVFLEIRIILFVSIFVSVPLSIWETRKLLKFLRGEISNVSILKKLYFYSQIPIWLLTIPMFIYVLPFYSFTFNDNVKNTTINVASFFNYNRDNVNSGLIFKDLPELPKKVLKKFKKGHGLERILKNHSLSNLNEEDIKKCHKSFQVYDNRIKQNVKSLDFPKNALLNVNLMKTLPSNYGPYKYSATFALLAKHMITKNNLKQALNIAYKTCTMGIAYLDGRADTLSMTEFNVAYRFTANASKMLIFLAPDLHPSRKDVRHVAKYFSRLKKQFPKNSFIIQSHINGMCNSKLILDKDILNEIKKLVKFLYLPNLTYWDMPYIKGYKLIAKAQKKFDKATSIPATPFSNILNFVHSPKVVAAMFIAISVAPSCDSQEFAYRFKQMQYLDGSVVALALNAYKEKLGRFPESLEILDDWLGFKLPLDQFSAKPLMYSSSPMRLYSVGPDLKPNTKDDISLIPIWKSKRNK